MFEKPQPAVWPLYDAYERRARLKRSRYVHLHLRLARRWIVRQFRAVGQAVAWLAAERQRRHNIYRLQQLDDRMLADIGVTRGEIEHVVRHGRWMPAPRQAAVVPIESHSRPARRRAEAKASTTAAAVSGGSSANAA